ncbi:large-conductance mechanosensitive channel protein MscL [Haloflavibacter putidus]|uniref:Large-conductance mechanosensitive channel n=1 Tax=Haloflavibacter putidus TaxID=2576776 RepID=A0A507ZVA7_9FLAO|nr:large-conductance mechanosensitive channel protein MscL [Haloflavibacter putidus]TQD40174.1 large-conductance mechanosensitive channel protein MscL [Haloflavibacter putidus]
MKIIKEFKEFAIKGNMIDIAVGVIIGAAFNKVIDVLVKKIMMPPLSMLTSGINYEDKKLILQEAVEVNGEITSPAIAIEYGELFTAFLNFLIIAFVVFMVIRAMNRLRKNAQDPENKKTVTPKDIELLSDLKNLMHEQNELLKKK